MQAKNAVIQVSTSKVALDFLKLAGVSVATAVTFAAAASAVVLFLSSGV